MIITEKRDSNNSELLPWLLQPVVTINDQRKTKAEDMHPGAFALLDTMKAKIF